MIRKYQGYIAHEEQNWIQASWAKHFFFLAFYVFLWLFHFHISLKSWSIFDL